MNETFLAFAVEIYIKSNTVIIISLKCEPNMQKICCHYVGSAETIDLNALTLTYAFVIYLTVSLESQTL